MPWLAWVSAGSFGLGWISRGTKGKADWSRGVAQTLLGKSSGREPHHRIVFPTSSTPAYACPFAEESTPQGRAFHADTWSVIVVQERHGRCLGARRRH